MYIKIKFKLKCILDWNFKSTKKNVIPILNMIQIQDFIYGVVISSLIELICLVEFIIILYNKLNNVKRKVLFRIYWACSIDYKIKENKMKLFLR